MIYSCSESSSKRNVKIARMPRRSFGFYLTELESCLWWQFKTLFFQVNLQSVSLFPPLYSFHLFSGFSATSPSHPMAAPHRVMKHPDLKSCSSFSHCKVRQKNLKIIIWIVRLEYVFSRASRFPSIAVSIYCMIQNLVL